MDDLSNFFSGGVPAFQFKNHGDKAKGEIVSAELQQQRHIDTGTPLTWDDGSPRMQCKVILATTEHDPNRADDNGHRALYVKGKMQQAVAEALRKSGAKSLEIGGTLAVEYHDDGEPTKRGFNAPKLYKAAFKAAPAPTVSTEDLL